MTFSGLSVIVYAVAHVDAILRVLTMTDASRAGDEEIVAALKNGDGSLFEELEARFAPLIASIIRRYKIDSFSFDFEDFRQELLLALDYAVKSYDANLSVPFRAYAADVMKSRMSSAVKMLMRRKRFGVTVSIDDPDTEHPFSQFSPEDISIANERIESLRLKIVSLLSEYEKKVFRLFLEGFSYKDISTALSVSPKSVGNALQRVKHKLRPEIVGEDAR